MERPEAASDSELASTPITSSPPLPIPPRVMSPPEPVAKPRRLSSDHKSQSRPRRERSSSRNEWIRILTQERRENEDLHRDLLSLIAKLQSESKRADDAERKACEIAFQLKTMNEAKTMALHDTARATEELNLYKLQLERAQEEIKRAQKIVESLENQRFNAEQNAARYRDRVYKLRVEHLVYVARQAGHQQGFREGLARGREMSRPEGLRSPSLESFLEDHDRYDYNTGDSLAWSSSASDENMHDDFSQRRSETRTSPEAEQQLSASSPSSVDAMRFTIIQNLPPSPRHPHVDIPPLGFVPETDANSYIRIPPPHDLDLPPPTPRENPLTGIPDPEERPLPVPAPANRRIRISTGHTQNHRRRSTSESSSTTFSQFEMVKEPVDASQEGRSPMSVIPEMSDYRSPDSRHDQDGPGLRQQLSFSSMASINVNPAPRLTPRIVAEDLASLEEAGRRILHRDTGSDANGANDVEHGITRRRSTSSANTTNTVPDITIDPPTRPTSATHGSSPNIPRRMGSLLSPADAQRPRLPAENGIGSKSSGEAPSVTMPPPAMPISSGPTTDQAPPVVYSTIPPGFVATSFTPALHPGQLLPPLFEETTREPASGDNMPGAFYDTTYQVPLDAVIPDRALYSNHDFSESSSEVSSGMGSDANTLTTPPARTRTPIVPYRNSSTHQSAARAPPPQSTTSGTPHSLGYLYTPSTDTMLDIASTGTPRLHQAKKKRSKASTRSGHT